MIPSLRLIRLLAVGAPFWLLGALMPYGWLAAVVFLAALLGLTLREMIEAPQARDFGAHRDLPPRFAHGEEAWITLGLTNRSRIPVKVRVRDELPAALQLMEPLSLVEIPPGGEGRCRYRVRVHQRGAHEFGHIVLRAQHGTGLWLRQFSLPVPDRIRVYPRFRGVDDYGLLARIDRRDEVVRRPRRVQGEGTDFESLRPYVAGEDLRRVDWKATARRGALISRNRQIEKGQQVAVLLDAGRLMAEVIDGYSKLDHAMNAAIMLSHVAQRRGDSLAVACFSNRIETFLPPVRGASIVARVLEALYTIEARPLESDYWQVVAEMMSRLRRRSLLVMITDVLDAASSGGLINNLQRAAAKHLVLCVVLTGPQLREAATGSPTDLAGAFRQAAACDIRRRRRLALERMRAGGIQILETEPARLSIQLVRRYLEIRRADVL